MRINEDFIDRIDSEEMETSSELEEFVDKGKCIGETDTMGMQLPFYFSYSTLWDNQKLKEEINLDVKHALRRIKKFLERSQCVVKYSEPFAYCSWQGLSGGEVESLKPLKSIRYFRSDGIMNIEYAIELKFKRAVEAARFLLTIFKISSVMSSFSQNYMTLYRDSFDASGTKMDRFKNMGELYKVFFYDEPFKSEMIYDLGYLRNATALIMGVCLSDTDKMHEIFEELRAYAKKRTQE